MTDEESLHNAGSPGQPNMGNSLGTSSAQVRPLVVTHQFLGSSPTSHQTTIPEVYHLTGIENYGSWAFRMRNVLLRDGLFDYCIVPPSENVS